MNRMFKKNYIRSPKQTVQLCIQLTLCFFMNVYLFFYGESNNRGKQDCNPCAGGTSRRLSCHRSSRGGMVYHSLLWGAGGGLSLLLPRLLQQVPLHLVRLVARRGRYRLMEAPRTTSPWLGVPVCVRSGEVLPRCLLAPDLWWSTQFKDVYPRLPYECEDWVRPRRCIQSGGGKGALRVGGGGGEKSWREVWRTRQAAVGDV